MTKFEITIEEILSHTVIVEAENYDEAVEQVRKDYVAEEIVLTADDFLDVVIW